MKQVSFLCCFALALMAMGWPTLAQGHPVLIGPDATQIGWLVMAAIGVALTGPLRQADEALLHRICVNQDQGALLTLLQRHRREITAVAHGLYPKGVDEEELLQELYLLLFAKLSGQEPPRNFMGWLTTVMRNRMIDGYRHQKTQRRYHCWQAQQPNSYLLQPDQTLDHAQLIATAMACLRPREAAVITRFYLHGQPYEAIATELDYTHKQVCGLMYRGMRRMRRELAGQQEYFCQ
jgi:RNA polymerase sigma factor (sigma-70 family)